MTLKKEVTTFLLVKVAVANLLCGAMYKVLGVEATGGLRPDTSILSAEFPAFPVFPMPLTGEQVPAIVFRLLLELTWVTSGPGFGNMTSVISIVLHDPDPRLATNMSGRAKKETAGAFPEPEGLELVMISTAAQFMYISRLPILLNQVLFDRKLRVSVPLCNIQGLIWEYFSCIL